MYPSISTLPSGNQSLSKPRKKAPSIGQVRIIGGRWRSRRLSFPAAPGLRPTGDRMRETLFNWLSPKLPGARCLDLFAGSGALGIEAASRGAAAVVLVERDSAVAAALKQNCALLAATEIEIVHAEALAWLETRGEAYPPFDIVFLDPPFAANLVALASQRLVADHCLAPGALIYVERAIDSVGDHLYGNWRLLRTQPAGRVVCQLYQVV
ncbi:MAG: 16S rRNA (guanine(966)-N(2))-methyltransferase RsmD [Porticoccaceae bacterium]